MANIKFTELSALLGASVAASDIFCIVDVDADTSYKITVSEAAIAILANLAGGAISQTELSYLNGVTSEIQTQLDGKQATLTLSLLSALIVSADPKTTPVAADTIPIIDSEDSSLIKEITYDNLRTALYSIPIDTQVTFGGSSAYMWLVDGTPRTLQFRNFNTDGIIQFQASGELDFSAASGGADATMTADNFNMFVNDVTWSEFDTQRTQNEVAAHMLAVESDGTMMQFPVRKLIADQGTSGNAATNLYANHYDGWMLKIRTNSSVDIENMTERNGTLANHTDVPEGDVRILYFSTQNTLKHEAGNTTISNQDYLEFSMADGQDYLGLVGDVIAFVNYNDQWKEVYRARPNGFLAMQAGENITANDVCVMLDDGLMYKANATTQNEASGMIALAYSTVTAGNYAYFVTEGELTDSGLTTGRAYYVGTSDGTKTTTAPSTSGNVVRQVGYAMSTTKFRVDVSPTYIEIT